MDSIRKALNNDHSHGIKSLIAKIQLLMNTENGEHKVFVLVEGSDDKKFFDNIFASNVFVLESIGGKRGLYDILRAEEIVDKRVLAIRDRDYSDPEDYPERMFAYDFCSLELMLLSHQNVQKRLKQLCVFEEDKIDFPLQEMRHIAPFSILREKNEREKLRLRLDKGVLAGLQNQSDRFPDMKLLFRNILVDNQKTLVDEKIFSICENEARIISDNRLWDITNGHDICLILDRISRMKKQKLGEAGYRLLMFCIYRKEDFFCTQLCKSLIEYQKKHELCFFE